MQTFFEVDADQVEVGDQIIVDGDPIEVTSIDDDGSDYFYILFRGFSHESGDSVQYRLHFKHSVEIWGI